MHLIPLFTVTCTCRSKRAAAIVDRSAVGYAPRHCFSTMLVTPSSTVLADSCTITSGSTQTVRPLLQNSKRPTYTLASETPVDRSSSPTLQQSTPQYMHEEHFRVHVNCSPAVCYAGQRASYGCISPQLYELFGCMSDFHDFGCGPLDASNRQLILSGRIVCFYGWK